jgi:DNA-binding NarL/FixJ family response regulator
VAKVASAAAADLQRVRDRFARVDPTPEKTHAAKDAPAEDALKVIADHIASVTARMIGPARDRMLRLLFIEGLESTAETIDVGGIFDGARGLSTSERAVMEMVAQGRTSREIARQRDVSHLTIKAQIASVLHKLGAKSRSQAVYIVNQRSRGLV